LLLEAGAELNAKNSWKITPINIAMLLNHFGIVKRLLNEPEIDVNCKDENGRTMISLSMEKCTLDTYHHVQYLLEKKVFLIVFIKN
jgi:hypothetical protein